MLFEYLISMSTSFWFPGRMYSNFTETCYWTNICKVCGMRGPYNNCKLMGSEACRTCSQSKANVCWYPDIYNCWKVFRNFNCKKIWTGTQVFTNNCTQKKFQQQNLEFSKSWFCLQNYYKDVKYCLFKPQWCGQVYLELTVLVHNKISWFEILKRFT